MDMISFYPIPQSASGQAEDLGRLNLVSEKYSQYPFNQPFIDLIEA